MERKAMRLAAEAAICTSSNNDDDGDMGTPPGSPMQDSFLSSTLSLKSLTTIADHCRSEIAYYFDKDVETIDFGTEHPMKPYRIAMTHSLVLNYGLYRKMQIYRPERATLQHMLQYHSSDYMQFLEMCSTKEFYQKTRSSMMGGRFTNDEIQAYKMKYNLHQSEDCPTFERLFEFCQISTGGSLAGAWRLNKGSCDVAVNWSGGMHHAKRTHASGFCYVNDVVLAIYELLKYHKRVLYIDIDVHHGDVSVVYDRRNRTRTFHTDSEYWNIVKHNLCYHFLRRFYDVGVRRMSAH